MFAEKAGNDDVAKALDLKVNKSELNQFSSIIKLLNERFKKMSLLQNEIAKSILPGKASGSVNAKEAKNSKLKRRQFVAQ